MSSAETDADDGSDAPAGADGRDLFGLLGFGLALTLILHQLWWYGFDARHPLVLVAAGWVLLRPASVPRVLALLAAAVAGVAVDMPDVGDHVLLIGVCGAGILSYAVITSLAARRLPEPGALFERIAPFLRAAVIVLYAAVALSKLNADFLDPATSCAAAMSSRIVWFDPGLLGSWRIEPAIWGTISVEASLPLLLALRRTRGIGLLLGAGFHLVLALAGNVPFSALMLALYVAFLPVDAPARVRALLAGLPPPEALRAHRHRLEPVALAAMGACWLAAGLLADANPALAEALVDYGARLVIALVVGAAVGVGLALRGRRIAPTQPVAGTIRALHPVLLAAIGLLVLNAASPYLGLKTETTFSMFSGLRTEPGHWNSAIVPEALRVFPLQDDLVRVLATDDPVLQRTIDDAETLPRAELDRYLRRNPGAHASVEGPDGLPAPGPIATSGAEVSGIPAQGLLDRLGKLKPVPVSAGGC